jgi:hypothetical protein
MQNRKNRFAVFMLSGLLALSASVAAESANAARGYFGHGAPSGAAALPAGEFRSSLESLPAGDQQRAIQWLQSIEFTGHDLEAMRVDRQGGIYYADRFVTGKSSSGRSSAGAAAQEGVSADSVLKLHSRPGATYSIFIDFDGGHVENTAWNASSGAASLQAAPYDTNGKPGNFSAAEVDEMVDIWRRVAEDFSPFEVDVTTEDPGSIGPKTAWVLVTDSKAGGNSLPEAAADSTAYINTLGSTITTYYTPAFVYHNNLGTSAAVAGAVSHSTGHLVGLSHDIDVSGNGVDWGAIMGLDHTGKLTQWSKGSGGGMANPQDDIAILMGRMGMRHDDHDDSRFDSGTPLVLDALGRVAGDRQGSANHGVIEDRDDIDVFAFGAGAGTLDIVVEPQVTAAGHDGANLDIQVSLYDASGKRLLRQDARNDVAVRLKKQLPAGRYKLEVTGVGPDSGYGSLGQYVISGSVPGGGKRASLAP